MAIACKPVSSAPRRTKRVINDKFAHWKIELVKCVVRASKRVYVSVCVCMLVASLIKITGSSSKIDTLSTHTQYFWFLVSVYGRNEGQRWSFNLRFTSYVLFFLFIFSVRHFSFMFFFMCLHVPLFSCDPHTPWFFCKSRFSSPQFYIGCPFSLQVSMYIQYKISLNFIVTIAKTKSGITCHSSVAIIFIIIID